MAKTKTEALIYPERFGSQKKLFWLVCFFQKTARLEELKKATKKVWEARRLNTPLGEALWVAQQDLVKTLEKETKFVVEDGLLLFAHQDTTVFQQPDRCAE